MKAFVLYRIASILLILFAVGHTLGFRQNNPDWKADAVLGLMQSVHFNALGFNRTRGMPLQNRARQRLFGLHGN